VGLQVVCSIPQSWSQKKQRMALAGEVRPTGKPDADNVLKAMCDGMNGVVWRDDAQAVEVSVSKRYGPTPGVTVRVESLEAAPQAALVQEDALCV
jgi:Holliday junction resolvase RusA-like endonuclease